MQTPQDKRSEQRPLWIAGGLFLLGAALTLMLRAAVDVRTAKAMAEDRIDITIPDPRLTPADVVRLQVESMRHSTADGQRLEICYSLASPANRSVTGPFENFSRLVRSEPYAELGRSTDYQIGEALLDGDYAAVTVSTLGADDVAMAFRFVLARQEAAPYQGCWMTEAVLPVSTVTVAENEVRTID